MFTDESQSARGL